MTVVKGKFYTARKIIGSYLEKIERRKAMNKNLVISIGLVVALGFLGGCARQPKVTRTPVKRMIDLSGRWNDSDSQMVSKEMINDCLERTWLERFNEKNSRKPVVIVAAVTNRSSEHINAQVFIKDLERTLLNSGRITFVANRQERQDIRDERNDQQTAGETNPDTINPKGQETGADFMLQGSINSVKDEIKGKYVILYQVNLELIDLTNNQKVWIGQKDIKKLVKRAQYSL